MDQRGGVPVLRKLAVDRGRITVYLDALASRLDEAAIVRELTGTLREIADPTLEKGFDESDIRVMKTASLVSAAAAVTARAAPAARASSSYRRTSQAISTLERRRTALSGGQQKALRSASSYIDRELGEDFQDVLDCRGMGRRRGEFRRNGASGDQLRDAAGVRRDEGSSG